MLQGSIAPLPERRIEVGDITVFTDKDHVALGTALAEAASEPHEWVGLGRVDAGPLTLVLARNQAEFSRWSRGRLPSWGAGATLAGSKVVMIRLDAGDPHRTLRHELAHVVLHHAVHVRVPLWFDEGYAVLAAREYGRFASLRLNLAVATGRVPELRELDAALRGSSDAAETAYAMAGTAVAELQRRGRNSDLRPLIAALERGMSFEDAVSTETGFTLDRFEEAWHMSLRRHYNWVVWLATGGLWLLVTLLLGWAAATRRRREAPRRAALDVGWPQPPEDDETITIQAVGPPSA